MLLPLNALRNYASVYACMFDIPIMHHVKLLISALISFVYVHGVVCPYALVFGVCRVLFAGVRVGDVTWTKTYSHPLIYYVYGQGC